MPFCYGPGLLCLLYIINRGCLVLFLSKTCGCVCFKLSDTILRLIPLRWMYIQYGLCSGFCNIHFIYSNCSNSSFDSHIFYAIWFCYSAVSWVWIIICWNIVVQHQNMKPVGMSCEISQQCNQDFVYWDMSLCCWIGACICFRGMCYFFIKGSRFMKSNHKPLKMREILPLKHQVPLTFETSGPTYLVTLHHIPEDWNPPSLQMSVRRCIFFSICS